MNYCEIRCKYDDDFNISHVIIDQNWNAYLNYQMIQSISVLKEMIDVRDCVREYAILKEWQMFEIFSYHLISICF